MADCSSIVRAAFVEAFKDPLLILPTERARIARETAECLLEVFKNDEKLAFHQFCVKWVAYHGMPDNAYQFFIDAHLSATLTLKEVQEQFNSKNPADVIMDMLGSEESRIAILNFYNGVKESDRVNDAIKSVRDSVADIDFDIARKLRQTAGLINRMSSLEARAKRRSTLGQTLYLPLIFIVYGLLLGTVYIQTQSATFILSGLGVFSCASGLFMFPTIYNYLHLAMQIFSLEYSDGIGRPVELVLQTFMRFVSISLFPVIAGSTIVYLLIISYTQYSIAMYVMVVLFNVVLNHTWISLLIFVIVAIPDYAHRISPVLSAVAGFAGGFFVPPRFMPQWYSWLFYINPNYYGFSAVIHSVLQEIELPCSYDSTIECYPSTGRYILSYFSLHNVNVSLNIMILCIMIALFLVLAWLSLLIRYVYPPNVVIAMIKTMSKRGSDDDVSDTASVFEHPVVPQINRFSNIVAKMSALNKRESPPSVPTFTSYSRISAMMLQQSHQQHQSSHEVWRPGKKLLKKDSSKQLIEMRRRSFLRQVNTFHGLVSDTVTTNTPTGNPSSRLAIPTEEVKWKRAQQWSNIVNSTVEEAVTDDEWEFEPLPSAVALEDNLSPPASGVTEWEESIELAGSGSAPPCDEDGSSEGDFVFPEIDIHEEAEGAKLSPLVSNIDERSGTLTVSADSSDESGDIGNQSGVQSSNEYLGDEGSGDSSDDEMYQIEYYETQV